MDSLISDAPSPAGLSTVGGIDCDVHPAVPSTEALFPYLDDYWRASFKTRGFERLNLAMTGAPASSPLGCRADWRVAGRKPGTSLDDLRAHALDAFGTRLAICNPVHAGQIMHSDDMGAVLCRAVNQWLAAEWLDREPRLRGSIIVSAQNNDLAIEEIERAAADPRFVQVLLLAMNDEPLGKRRYWPIFAAAERLGLPVAIHAGGSYRHAPTASGWPETLLEDYVAQAAICESQLLSLITEGVFAKFPKLTVVFTESGFLWLPSFFWRADKTWRGTRAETPWVDELPSSIVKRHVRFTIQPVDTAPAGNALERTLAQIDCDDLLLFSTDYPHWQFDGKAALPAGFGDLAPRILVDNPLATYPRLRHALSEVPSS